MGQPDEVIALFAGHDFGPPRTDAEIRGAEEALGEPLPPALRELYLAFDGFLGTAGSRFLWPLLGREGLVELNRFFRGDDLFDHGLISRCLFFGEDGCGAHWGFHRDLPGKVIKWAAQWGADFEAVGDDPLDAWRIEKALYESPGEAD